MCVCRSAGCAMGTRIAPMGPMRPSLLVAVSPTGGINEGGGEDIGEQGLSTVHHPSVQQHLRREGVHVWEQAVHPQALCVRPRRRLRRRLRRVPGVRWVIGGLGSVWGGPEPSSPPGGPQGCVRAVLGLVMAVPMVPVTCRVPNLRPPRVPLRQRPLPQQQSMGM